jgi:hypothetical protein
MHYYHSSVHSNFAYTMLYEHDAGCCALHKQAEDRLHPLLVTCIVWKCAMMAVPGCSAAGESLDCRMIFGN